ncbi:FAD-dependent oxidoreductase [Pseudogulbenkiania subflava]|uniref:Pyridine nucleotide-disulfide oxidoreductase family protein n=1 Tax=Pseudogulbenkiania subflava DSM 22618 TaxID=1123014 RepID=A0A1Y6BXK0_9NEIS|nr:FAD-dependent oxidoreductase [Pseudogulbenkiania subflava]SMF23185.1 pyridine nucleotide-disulfide oxidoreductase family protein [Pseudogulbenkiania subflava DSM 22618]SMF32560.1 pyridine nucleotide-disulfide oxidoreductase family protein [Pseudogulbenkiania subflava DSM 22618]SMF47619.1 pyridine nucleotide-disulfide oxidoreductase family protein [Pseudogulbenkiania subflava DSM 22618]
MKRLILVGGGHAHLGVLRALAMRRLRAAEVLLVTPEPQLIYSGMVPGWMAGHYRLDQCGIDLQPLARAAGARLILAPVAGLDAERRCIVLPDGTYLEYDLLSLDVGSETDVSWLHAAQRRLLPVRPLGSFVAAWPQVLEQAVSRAGFRLAVVGGGAAGVELAFAARQGFVRGGIDAQVDLVASGPDLLAGHAPAVVARAERWLVARGIAVHRSRAAGTASGLLLANGEHLAADRIVAATGARAPCWLALSKLALDPDGYVAVDDAHRSRSHAHVFAAGDVCAREDAAVARSGVHAVHAGPVLAYNLRAALEGGAMRAYVPRACSLYLISTGPKHAIASWGSWSTEGAWVWHWKDWIDRRFIRRHRMPHDVTEPYHPLQESPYEHESH